LIRAYESVKRLGANNFANDGVFIEKFIANARHIEVQVFGDGKGHALAIGERDCSSQRRNQKVLEECPAPNLTEDIRHRLHITAEKLLAAVQYRNAGTVEFIYDVENKEFYFLEVNTRLQVEHGVTEEVYGIDLVEWMISLAANKAINLNHKRQQLHPQGHAIQARIYAEDPYLNFQPCAGLLSKVKFPQEDGVRIDTWIETGITISPFFDPMLAKVIVHAENRTQSLQKLQHILDQIQLYGSETNLTYLRYLTRDSIFTNGQITTGDLNNFIYQPNRIDILQGGVLTTIQDLAGRQGYWHVGVPPSGAFDRYSLQLLNRLLGNSASCAGLEITFQGPTLRFSCDTQIALGGAEIEAKLDGKQISMWQIISVKAGQKLVLGRINKIGSRTYLAVSGGICCPDYLGSKATFTLGEFGGHNGRALRAGDVLHLAENIKPARITNLPTDLIPKMSNQWELRVIYGPQGAPDFFTQKDIDMFFRHEWEVHYNSNRTGIRLIGPKPNWARTDGGEAGLHPSNIHDNAYAFGTIDFTGDMPVILGPDGPSLGGFVCPATVISADLWKLGQLRSGDKIRFKPISIADAIKLEKAQIDEINMLTPAPVAWHEILPETPILDSLDAADVGDEVVYRAAGDHFILVEYGKQHLDIRLRFRAHALMQWLQQNSLPGIRELTPGICSLQIHFDSQQLSHQVLLAHLKQGEYLLAKKLTSIKVPSRIVYLPLSWDDSACHLAVQKYIQSVRENAPWCPNNIEFIRRINGLSSIEDVKRIVFDASYLVMGLGDVYLGAPVAIPIDPRHRLVTTKYNPARTWTAENSVGIGGSYLCIYGMEGPGGYQFIGRTLQMWNRYHQTLEFAKPWLLRFFDQIRFYPVSQEELLQIRRDFPNGRYRLKIEETTFSLGEYQNFLTAEKQSISQCQQQREKAFQTELEQWHATGQFDFVVKESDIQRNKIKIPADCTALDSSVSGNVWTIEVCVGQQIEEGQTLMVLESMKMEIPIIANTKGVIHKILVKAGEYIDAGQVLILFKALED
ncbi:MAG TPA: urea carboxylase, partial [Pasteurellaceae bacterium]|nr:urea carboxylase [Pasteurellaceae bacterium]